MKIEYIDSKFISPEQFYNKYIINKIPVVIQNSDPQYLNKYKYIKNSNNKVFENASGKYLNLYWNISFECTSLISDYIKDSLFNRNDFNIRKTFRIWSQNKGTLTPAHYDLCNIDLVYFVLSGKKKFFLKPPNSKLAHFPFMNLEFKSYWNDYEKNSLVIDLNPGDMLYLPREWYHQVRTLEDDTISISITATDFNNKSKPLSKRNNELNTIYYLFNKKYIDGCEICRLVKKKIDYIQVFKRIIIELFNSTSINLFLISIAFNLVYRSKKLVLLNILLFYILIVYLNQKNLISYLNLKNVKIFLTSMFKNIEKQETTGYLSLNIVLIMILGYSLFIFYTSRLIKLVNTKEFRSRLPF